MALFTIEGELDDISGSGQTAGGTRPVQRHTQGTQAAPDRRRRRPLRHLQRPPLARNDRAADQELHPRERLRRVARQAPRGRPFAKPDTTARRPMSSPPARSLTDRIDALLPQTQCTKCGYDGCRPYAEAIAAGDAEINQCPPGGAAGIAKLAALTGRPVLPLNPANGVGAARCASPSSTNRSASVARCASRRVRLTRSSARRDDDALRHRRRGATAAICASRRARWTAS